ncbi:unnamed protein product [Arabidopsis thaliana]|uniref:Uncharacterized protein n=3 Tax=Arabidopsis TaxID=3701 RepID=A0A654FN07_ARATH|nr:unnamed protein product [Arabidopsis thaliana]
MWDIPNFLYIAKMNKNIIFSFTVLTLFVIFVQGVIGNLQQRRQMNQTWCSRPLLTHKQTGKCVIEDCESKCRQKWKGNGTQATCRNQCNCHFRCPWIQGQP